MRTRSRGLRVVAPAELGSPAATHVRRLVREAGQSQALTRAFDAALAAGDCHGALRALTKVAESFGKAQADAEGAGQREFARRKMIASQLQAAQHLFANRCVRKGKG